MVNTFVNADVEVTTGSTVLYTAPGATQSIMTTLSIANKDAANSGLLTVQFFNSNTSVIRILGSNLPIPVGGILVFDKPLNLEAADRIELIADANNVLVGFASILQITA